MQPSSISSEDFESVDFEEPRPKAIPQAPSFSPNHTLSASSSFIDDASIMPDSPASELKENEWELPMKAIDSFLPILQFLPGLALVEGAYHHFGSVSQADMEKLCAYTRKIGEFTLTDNVGYRVHPGTLLRVVQLHNRISPGPLFPSLNRLRVVGAQSSFDHLNLFLTPALRSLEVVNIPEAQKTVLSVFLDAIAQEAPNLTQITLGPGKVPGHLLQTCSKFNHLSQLELIDLVPSFDLAFLESIGSLPALDAFTLHAEGSWYLSLPEIWGDGASPPEMCGHPETPFPEPSYSLFSQTGHEAGLAARGSGHRTPSPVPSTRSQSPTADQIPEVPSSLSDGPIQAVTHSSPVTEPPEGSVKHYFTVLKKLRIIGSLALIDDLVGLVASDEIVDLGLTLVWSPSPVVKLKKLLKKKHVAAIAPPVVQPTADESFATILESAHRKWFETLTRIHIGHKNRITSTINRTVTPAFPATTFESLLLHHTLKCLEISGWMLTSTSISDAFQSLVEKAPSKLESLRLPIDNTSPGISLTRLRTIAEACPGLVSLQCNIEHLLNVPEYPSRIPAANVLSHGLEELSVGNPSPHTDPQRPLLIARHLNVLFPNLKRIVTHPGYNAEQWAYIGNLVELCQNARLDDTRRPQNAT